MSFMYNIKDGFYISHALLISYDNHKFNKP